MRNICRTLTISICTALLAAGTLTFADADARSISYDLNIPSEDLTAALQSFAIASHHKLLYKAELTAGKISRALKGHFTAQEALETLLSGTGLSYEITGSSVVLIKDQSEGKTSELREGDSPLTAAAHSTGRDGQSDTFRVAQVDQGQTKHFEIKAKPLADALMEFEVQSGLTVVAPTTLTAGKKAAAVRGDLGATDALRRLLKGSGLTFAQAADGTIAIQAIPSNGPVQASAGESGLDKDLTKKAGLDEVVVIGTNIRGTGPIGSPIQSFGRADIDQSGALTVQDFMATVTQNFGGDQSLQTINTVGHQPNPGLGAGVNLRGVGSESTLVLINGHRTALGGTGEFVDVSLIPLSAVERIDVLPDGASAIYGSDAVGGVVNFVMKENYQGAESRASFGGSTQGGGETASASQLIGTSWSTGSALLDYEYYKRASLPAGDREFSNQAGDYSLIPAETRNSIFASGHQYLGPVEFLADGSYSHRDASDTAAILGTPEDQSSGGVTDQYSASLGAQWNIDGNWLFQLTGVYSKSRINSRSFDVPDDGTGVTSNLYSDRITSIDGKIDGKLFQLPAGYVRLAIGAGHRSESFSFSAPNVGFNGDTGVSDAFGEILIPILPGPRDGKPSLSINVADRFENYSTFGNTNNPKVGVAWLPLDLLTIRSSYGTSFRAPSTYQLNPFNALSEIYPFPDLKSSTGATNTLLLLGNNPSLAPETATSWTLGFDVRPLDSNFKMSTSYYHITYSNRIFADPITSLQGILNDPAQAFFVTRRGSISDTQFNALIERYLSGEIPVYGCAVATNPTTGACTESPSDIDAIADRRLANVSKLATSGIDLLLDDRWSVYGGSIHATLNATYIIEYSTILVPGAGSVSLLNTTESPLGFRGRASVEWLSGPLSVAGAANYANAYRNNALQPEGHIASWTTFDLVSRYDLGPLLPNGFGRGLSLTLSVINLLDRLPPSVPGQPIPLGYDPANASPLGRVIIGGFVKRW